MKYFSYFLGSSICFGALQCVLSGHLRSNIGIYIIEGIAFGLLMTLFEYLRDRKKKKTQPETPEEKELWDKMEEKEKENKGLVNSIPTTNTNMKKSIIYICIFALAFLVSYHFTHSQSNPRKKIIAECQAYQKQLPQTLPNTEVRITNVEVDNDFIVYTYELNQANWDLYFASEDILNSDENVARMLSNYAEDYLKTFIDAGFGMKYIYKNAETGEQFGVIEMSNDRIKEIQSKVTSGELNANTLLEMCKMELEKLELPSQVGEELWLNEAYVEGNHIVYKYKLDEEVNAADITLDDISETKRGLVEDLKANGMITLRKKEIFNENVHFIYVFCDSRGEVYQTINIGPSDIFGGNE